MTFPETPEQEDPRPVKRNKGAIPLPPLQIEIIREATKARQGVCNLCRWIYESVLKTGALAGNGPQDIDGKPLFPPRAKVWHLWLERILPRRAGRWSE